MKQQQPKAPFRLALRAEGTHWNAYCARLDSMEGAVWLGSIALRPVEGSLDVRQRFIVLMQDVLILAAKDIAGADLSWPTGPQPAPESERSGNG